MVSPLVPNCLSKETDLWRETLDERDWLKDAISYEISSKNYGEIFEIQFINDFPLQIFVAQTVCKARNTLIEKNYSQPNGRRYDPPSASHVDNMSRYLQENAVWKRFYRLLPKSDFPDEKYVGKNRHELIRIFALNLLHPDPFSPI